MNNSKQLQTIVKDSGLETTKAKVILEKFHDYFDMAAEWEVKAKSIVVKDASQTADMQTARVGRLFLREKRIAIEKTRKELKEQALREGKAIDGIANILKGIIVPIEEYLNHQEKFVERQVAALSEKRRIAAEEKAEAERIEREKAEAEERERQRLENIKLKKEAEAKEKKRLTLERKTRLARESQEKNLALEKSKAEVERLVALEREQSQREDAHRRAVTEKEKHLKQLEELRIKREAEQALKEAEIVEVKRIQKNERAEKELLQKELAAYIICPKCHHKFILDQEEK